MASDFSGSSPFDELAHMARTGDPGLAAASLKIQTELFLRQASAGEPNAGTFSALALLLLPLVDEATARHVAVRICAHEHAPEALVRALYERGGGTADIVLERTLCLPPDIFHLAIAHPDPRLATRLAARPDLGDEHQLHLLGRGETATSLALARNHGIRLNRSVLAGLVSAARCNRDMASALFGRSDVDRMALMPLYQLGSDEDRALMREIIAKRLKDKGLARAGRESSQAERESLLDVSILGMPHLLAVLLEIVGRDEAFAAAASADASRELVGLALVAAGISPEDATRMLLRTGDEVARNSLALHAVVHVMRTTSPQAAELILSSAWPRQHVPAQMPGQHQHVPVMAPGGTPARGTRGMTTNAMAGRRVAGQTVRDRLRGQT